LSAAAHFAIDVHSHVVPEYLPAYLGARRPANWPETVDAPESRGLCHRHVMINGKHFRTVSEKSWKGTRRLTDLPAMGLTAQVISPMPELLSYWLAPGDAQPLLRYLNEHTAQMCAQFPGRLLGLGAVALQDIDLAIDELRYCVRELNLVGVELGSNINGVVIGDMRFDPFFEACEALNAVVFVHALKPTGMDRLFGPPALQQVLAYASEIGLAAASVITSNLMLRRPKLRIAFSHGGGSLAMLLPRLQQGWQAFPAIREAVLEAPVSQARRLFFDTLVFDAATLRHLAHVFGTDQLMIGTDYPFNFSEQAPLKRLAEAGFDERTQAHLAWHNAERFLGREIAALRPNFTQGST
jgi:aminocarboxymuconate-semialdehyde decarboxylase